MRFKFIGNLLSCFINYPTVVSNTIRKTFVIHPTLPISFCRRRMDTKNSAYRVLNSLSNISRFFFNSSDTRFQTINKTCYIVFPMEIKFETFLRNPGNDASIRCSKAAFNFGRFVSIAFARPFINATIRLKAA